MSLLDTTKGENNQNNVQQFINLWKKHFGDKLQICPDCTGFVIPVCETALRSMLLAQFKRIDKQLSIRESNIYTELMSEVKKKYHILGSQGGSGSEEQDKKNHENFIKLQGENDGYTTVLSLIKSKIKQYEN